MALVKCPECGRENVSDSAESCPGCGYGIKNHYDRIKSEKIERERLEKEKEMIRKYQEDEEQREIETKKREDDFIKSIPPMERNHFFIPILELLFSAFVFSIGFNKYLKVSETDIRLCVLHEESDPRIPWTLLMAAGIALICYGLYLLIKDIKRYHMSSTNLEGYQQMIYKERYVPVSSSCNNKKEKDDIYDRIAAEERMKLENIKCPFCSSNNVTKITNTEKVVNIALFGIFGQKRKYQWHCNNCKSNF